MPESKIAVRLAAAVVGISCLMTAATTVHAGTWVGYNQGLRNLTVNGIGIAPSDPGTLYIQARSLGIYKSTDGGATWSKTATFNNDKGPGYDHLIHQGPAVHPGDPDIVWVASGGKVYKTVDGGGSWSESSSGTTVNGCNGVHGVAIDPNDPDHLFAGTIVAGCDGGVFESSDGGSNWVNIAGSAVGGGIDNDAWPIALDATDTNRLYAGSPHNAVYRSVDGGHTWLSTPPVSGDHSTYEVVINPIATNEIWCREVGGTWVSTDYGVTWTRQTQLFGDAAIQALRFAPSNAQVAYAIVGNTIWRSGDNGQNWSPLTDVLGGPRCVEIDPTDPDVVYVGTWGLGMYKSVDGGQTFDEINVGLPMTQQITGYQAFGDPLEPGAMYCILGGNVVYRLGAEETDWQYYSVSPDDYIEIDPFVPNRWYCTSGGLWRSDDAGLTWNEVYWENPDTLVYGFWLDPRRCGRILIGDRDGWRVLSSDDYGDTWTLLGTVPPFDGYITGIAGDPFDPNAILLSASPPYHSAGQNGYIWRSTDRGQTWEHIRDRMFYGDWRIGNGYWKLQNYAMRQEQKCCTGYHVNLDHHTFADGTYECRVRILDSDQSNTDYWAGFTIRAATPDDHFTDSGWLVYMRRNGVVALHNRFDGTVINAAQTPVVGDTSQWTTLRLVATGNDFELYADETLVGTYTDPNHWYDGPGYFSFHTNATLSEFDNLDIQAETTFTDTFDQSVQFGAYWGRFIEADPHNPGRFAYTTQWGGMWYSRDQGATWEKISPDSRNGYLYYRPLFSLTYDGNLYVSSGYGYSWRIDNYHNDGMSRQQIGQNLSYSSLAISEDPFDPNRLYTTLYDLGVSIYDDDDIAGTLAGPVPAPIDFDHDGDIDQDDYGYLQLCLSGQGTPQTDPACYDARIDEDDDVDENDAAWFLDCMSGPTVPPDPICVYCPNP